MAATQQALLMASDNAVTVPEACVADPYYSCGPTNDPYWANVVLLLHMDGTDGSTTFVDSSTVARTIVAFSSAQVDTANKKFGTGSGYFPTGTNSYLTTGDGYDMPGDFTIEFWLRLDTVTRAGQIVFALTSPSSLNHFYIVAQTNGTASSIGVAVGSATINDLTYDLVVNTWYHIAVARSGSTVTLFKNGVERGTTTTTFSPLSTRVGQVGYEVGTGNSLYGYIDDLRITKGIARYTGNFNIPTAAFPDALETIPLPDNPELANTVLWLPFEDFDQNRSGALRDFSNYNHPMIASTSTAQNLVLWNGEGDKGGILYNATQNSYPIEFAPAATLDIGADNFYIEAWVFYTVEGTTTFGDVWISIHAGSPYGLRISRQIDSPPYALTWSVGGSIVVESSDSIPIEQWTHLACSREGTTLRLFVDGALVGSGTVATSYTTNSYVRCFACPSGTSPMLYGDNFRMVIGDAVHTAAFTPPPMVPTTQGRTVLSLHAEDTDDSSCYQPKTVTLAGSAAVSTTEKKFDTASFSVANAGTSTANGVVITDHMDFDFGTGDFTIEMWAYRSSNTYYGTLFYFTEAAEFSLLVAPTTGNIVLNYRSSGGTQANISTGVTFPLTTWQHVVVQRRGTNFEFYLNGVLGNTTAITGGASSTVNSAGNFYLGRTNASSALTWAGYIDEVRVTKGVARIANPNLPTAAFPDSAPDDPYWANVVLMLPMAVDFSDSSETTKTVTPAGDAQITATSPKFGIGSGLFDGTGDLLSVTHTSELTLGTSDFTFEAWIRLSEINRWHGIIGNGTGAGAIDFVVATTPNNFLRVYADSGTLNLNAVTALAIDTWYHVALVRSGDVFTIFLNGVTESTQTVAVTLSATSAWKIAGDYTSTPLKGQMAYARVTKGVARYPTSFTPPAQPNCDSVVPGNIVAVPGTSPLTGMSVVVQQQSIGDQNGAVVLSGVSATVNAGGLFSDAVTSSKTVALTGRSVTVSRGTLAVPAYPNLISVSTTTIEAVATGNTAKLTFTFFTDGTYTVVDQALTTRTSGTWIDTAQTNYSIPAISNQYRVVTINIFAGTSYTYSTLPFTLGTSFSVVIQNLASSTLNIFDFQLTISPTSTNPRYAEPYYYGTHRFKAVLSNDMS